jgi:hypothetical protein
VKTPDITLAQIVAVLLSVFGMAAAFGLDISQGKQDAIVDFITVMAPIVVAADAFIRHGRSKVAAAEVAAVERAKMEDPVAG